MNRTNWIRCTFSVRAAIYTLVFVALGALAVHDSSAALFTLTDANSVAQFDTETPNNNFNWFVGGPDLLAQQSFWYRVGSAGPEQSVHVLPVGVQGTTDANFDGNPDTLFVRYLGGNFNVETTYNLVGGALGSGQSDLGEQIKIVNLQASPLDFHFFQYADLDLSAFDAAVFTNTNAVDQFGISLRSSETVVTSVPSHREVALRPVTLNKLNDALPTTLIDNSAAGPGNVTWAFQWDVTIPAGSSFLISKDKGIRVIPEPVSALLFCVAAGLFAGVYRKR
jgi:hypothetical protein